MLLPHITRWTPQRKSQIVQIIDRRQFSRSEIMEFYNLSEEELSQWETDDKGGTGFHQVNSQYHRQRRKECAGLINQQGQE